MAKYSVGQKVIYTSEAREKVGLSKSVEATIVAVHEGGYFTNVIYSIKWPPTGKATVLECDLQPAIRPL